MRLVQRKGTLLPSNNKPLQLLTTGETLRSIHGVSYTRLWSLVLVSLIQEFAVDFQPPQQGCNGATGLYAGEQDLFLFMIDPSGWAEIDGEAFARGFFAWNSEVPSTPSPTSFSLATMAARLVLKSAGFAGLIREQSSANSSDPRRKPRCPRIA